MPFYEWLLEQRKRDDAIGKLACEIWLLVLSLIDVTEDVDATFADWCTMLGRCGARTESFAALQDAFEEWDAGFDQPIDAQGDWEAGPLFVEGAQEPVSTVQAEEIGRAPVRDEPLE